VRGDSGFCREELLAWCEANGVDYVVGLAKNERLTAETAAELAQAAEQYQRSDQAGRVFKEFTYQTRESWSRARRVVAKAEPLEKGANPRLVVTSLASPEWAAQALNEDLYCARGEMENRIKEQLMLFSDRTNTPYLRSNQIRLYFSSAAYLLMQALRRLGLQGTDWAKAQCTTLRLKLLKIGTLIRVTVRKVWVSMAGGCPYAERFRQVYAQLQAVPLQGCKSRWRRAWLGKISRGGSVPFSARKSLPLSDPQRRFPPPGFITVPHPQKSRSAATILAPNRPAKDIGEKCGLSRSPPGADFR